MRDGTNLDGIKVLIRVYMCKFYYFCILTTGTSSVILDALIVLSSDVGVAQ